jgi:hypothetical protein
VTAILCSAAKNSLRGTEAKGRDRRVIDEGKGIKKEILTEKNKGTGVREDGRLKRECYEVKQDSADGTEKCERFERG